MFYRNVGKRVFDLVCTSLLLVVLLPIFLAVALIVRIKLGSPVIFRQVRPGYRERLFPLFKFRTMTGERDAAANLLPDRQRLTPTGEFLRRTSLDELPELINVLRGELSLIGPRPLLVRYLPYFSDEERVRFMARPGITGLAQVSGRNNLRWDERLQTDIRYVASIGFGGDMKILLDTLRCVVHREGYQVDPGAVMLDLDAERKLRSEGRQ
jgi:undecaprenyl phosphate N,N'-diacetylbacillosamine 1-phosphate transferase